MYPGMTVEKNSYWKELQGNYFLVKTLIQVIPVLFEGFPHIKSWIEGSLSKVWPRSHLFKIQSPFA